MARIKVDGVQVEAREGAPLLEVLRGMGIRVPTLCHNEAVSPYGACRLCLVEVASGPRTMLAASCLYPVAEGIEVSTTSERVRRARRMVVELLLARCGDVPRVRQVAEELGVTRSRFPQRHEACLLCGLCVRGCAQIAGVGAIDFTNRGVHMELSSAFGVPSEACVGCATCVYLCPADAVRLDAIRSRPSPHRMDRSGRVRCAVCVPQATP
ncbi:MAG: (2Fe-2S)-binding protein [Planctomycetes bacterium]|nr:(2Fe-2S)-binding protein [Planctomycetota bacterium]